jgi:hypothetical protein
MAEAGSMPLLGNE